MRRTPALLFGLLAGVVLAGIAVGVLIPLLPYTWRTEPAVWGTSATLVALSVGAAFFASRPSRE